MELEYILNGQGFGGVANTLLQSGFNVNALRPWIGDDGRSYITQIQNGVAKAVPLINATATLRKDEWKLLDTVVVKAAKRRLRAVADLRAAGLEFNIPNGLGKTVLETQAQGDTSDAVITMDGLEDGTGDRPTYDLNNMPLPIISKPFSFSARQIAVSRNGGSPLDLTMAAEAADKVSEMAEKLTIGVASTFTFGGGTLYGYTNYPTRMTQTLTQPNGSNAATTIQQVLAMIQSAMNAYHYGPYMLYYSPSWSRYMNDEYKTYSNDTLLTRLKRIDNIIDVRQLDYLTAYDLVLVQFTEDVVREVIGMDVTTIQWESQGGMKLNFKVMAIMCPQLRADANSRTGIVHGSV